jgi:hypothetical protein
MSLIQPSHVRVALGAGEEWSKPYIKYGLRIPEPATPRNATSTHGMSSSARQQMSTVRGLYAKD